MKNARPVILSQNGVIQAVANQGCLIILQVGGSVCYVRVVVMSVQILARVPNASVADRTLLRPHYWDLALVILRRS